MLAQLEVLALDLGQAQAQGLQRFRLLGQLGLQALFELAELGVDGAELVATTKRQERDYARQAERMAEGFAGLVAYRSHSLEI